MADDRYAENRILGPDAGIGRGVQDERSRRDRPCLAFQGAEGVKQRPLWSERIIAGGNPGWQMVSICV